MTTRYRFRKEHANGIVKVGKFIAGDPNSEFQTTEEFAHWITIDRANALLEKWEAESKKLFGFGDRADVWIEGETAPSEHDTHVAILWNPKPIK